MKLLDYRVKVSIMGRAKNLKGSGIYINEDFCKETTKLKKSLWERVRKARKFCQHRI